MDKKLIPDALIAFISLSSDNLPKVISVAINTAIGTERAIIQAKLKNKYSKIIWISNPFPRNLSIALSRKLIKRINTIISREKTNGSINSRIKYLDTSRIQ